MGSQRPYVEKLYAFVGRCCCPCSAVAPPGDPQALPAEMVRARKSTVPSSSPDWPGWPWVHALRDVSGARMTTRLPCEILPGLLLGDKRCARDLDRLRELGVTHVLNVGGRAAMNGDLDYVAAGIEVHNLDASDERDYPMLDLHLDDARCFFARARAASGGNGKCLVHCVAGLNRSGVLACAEYMLHTNTQVLETVAYCRAKRGWMLLCNEGFQDQLVELARQHGLLGALPVGYSSLPAAPHAAANIC